MPERRYRFVKYIIVQAGGKGTRLGHLTRNKPKALVPIDNLPLLFHLFKKYPDKQFIIVADYKKDVLREYLSCFAEVSYQVVDAKGAGTCAGIRDAVKLIPDKEPFLLIWSDLLLSKAFCLPRDYREGSSAKRDYVGVTSAFSCRWSFINGEFFEERSDEHGVAGVFLFAEKFRLSHVPSSGEFVRWLKDSGMDMTPFDVAGIAEYGLLENAEKRCASRWRPFNRLTFEEEVVIKEPIDEQGRRLSKRERAWYEKVLSHGVRFIPRICSLDPLRMERLTGGCVHEIELGREEKSQLLKAIVGDLGDLHALDSVPADRSSVIEAYYIKTMDRLSKVRRLIPYSEDEVITVNGKLCRNIFFHEREFEQLISTICCERFALIHGDCTFSNIMRRADGTPVMLDPRGYFGHTELYGDERYDWAKLYYSIVGNYDQFNLKRFDLDIGGKNGSRETRLPEGEVCVSIVSNGWEELEDEFFELTESDTREIRLIHAIIWLSLTTYAWPDYDSICAAFYNGLFYLEDVL